jgi:predicted secreted protein
VTVTSGTLMILKLHNGTSYIAVGACTSHSFTQTYSSVDVSNKDSVWTTLLDGVGKKSTSIEMSGFVEANGDDAGFELLKAIADSATSSQELFELVLGDGEKISGTCELTSFAVTGADAQGTTYTASFVTSGAITRASV